MIDFIEDLPAEWRPKWEEMKRTTSNGLDAILGKAIINNSIPKKGIFLTRDIEDKKPEVPRLEQKFCDSVHEPELQVLLPIMQGLMRFLPENRISAADALTMLTESLDQDENS